MSEQNEVVKEKLQIVYDKMGSPLTRYKVLIDMALINLDLYMQETMSLENYDAKSMMREMAEAGEAQKQLWEARQRLGNGWFEYWKKHNPEVNAEGAFYMYREDKDGSEE